MFFVWRSEFEELENRFEKIQDELRSLRENLRATPHRMGTNLSELRQIVDDLALEIGQLKIRLEEEKAARLAPAVAPASFEIEEE